MARWASIVGIEHRRRLDAPPHADRLRTLARLGASDTLAREGLTAALRELTEAAAGVVGVARASVWLFDESTVAMSCVDLYDAAAGTHSAGATMRAPDHPAYFAALERELVIAAPEAATDPRTAELGPSCLAAFGIRSILDAAIHDGGRCAGVLCLATIAEVRDWTAEDEQFAAYLASHASRILEAARAASLQQSLRESEERFRAAFEQSAAGMAICDLDGRLLRANRRFCELVGYAEDELLEMTAADLVPPAERNRARAANRQLVRGDLSPEATAKRYLRKDGSYVWLETAANAATGPDGSVRHVVCVVTDVSERNATEQALLSLNAELEDRVAERTRALADVNDELEKFSYTVAHDLRAPLRAVEGFGRVLEESLGPTLKPPAHEYLGRMIRAASAMGRMVDDLLDLSRLARRPVQPEAVDLAAIAHDMIEVFRAGEPGRTVAFEAPAALIAHADPGLARVLLQNLLGNAWKFTSRTEAARIELGVAETSRGRAYFVRDNGVGFDMRYADRLFGVFQRLHAASEFEGSGIGLATVHRIVHRHGGEVFAEGEVGRGATFYFDLPPAHAGKPA